MADQESATGMDFDGVEVVLDVPLKRGDQQFERIRLRRPRAPELMGVSLRDVMDLDVGAMLKVIPRLSSPPLVDHELALLDSADFFALAVEISGFFLSRSVMPRSPKP